jgi:hypothetical protein
MGVHKCQFRCMDSPGDRPANTQQTSHETEFHENKEGTIYIYKVHVLNIKLAICHWFLKPEVNYLQILKCHLLLQS